MFKFLWFWQEETSVECTVRAGIRPVAAIGCRTWGKNRCTLPGWGPQWLLPIRTRCHAFPETGHPIFYLCLLAGRERLGVLSTALTLPHLLVVVPFPFQDESSSLSPPRIFQAAEHSESFQIKRPADKIPDCYQRSKVRGVPAINYLLRALFISCSFGGMFSLDSFLSVFWTAGWCSARISKVRE